MIKYPFFFGLIRIPLEILIVIGAFWLARDIRITTDLIPGVQLPTHSMSDAYVLVLGCMSYVILGSIFAFQKLYTIGRRMGILEEFFVVMKSTFLGFFVVIGILYLTNGFPYQTILIPRLILIYAFLIAMFGILIERSLLEWIRRIGLVKGWFARKRTLLICRDTDPGILDILSRAYDHTLIGYMSPTQGTSTLPYLGEFGALQTICADTHVDEVLTLSHDLPFDLKRSVYEYCQIHGITYRYIGNLYETTKNNTHIDFIGDIPFIEIRSIGITPWGRVIKRCFDISLSSILLLLLLPFFMITSLMIVIGSRGGVFYRSMRVGKGEKLFQMIKFRSMVQHADHMKHEILADNERTDGPLFKLTNDPRITRFGRWIRRWSIDELPQIWNVWSGNMSFMGPRPHLPEEVKKYTEKQKQVLTIKPGITGMAQVYGRDTNSFEREIELDLFYIENWSLLLDTKILLLTFRAVFRGR